MSFERIQPRLFLLLKLLLLGVALSACATTTAPVQEMSNARQSIRAATDAEAEKYAADVLVEAKKRLQSAIRELDAGEYERARFLALEAKHLALKAKQLAANKKKN